MLPEDIATQVVQQVVSSSKQNVTEQPKVNTLNSTIAKYIDAKKAEWTAKSKMEFSGIFKLLVDVLGDLEVSAITRSTVLELRSTLQNLPPNVYKKHPGMTIKQVISSHSGETMSLKTVNKHVARLGALLRYCVDEGMITGNPVSGLKLSEKRRIDEERSTYNPTDINNIVQNLPCDTAYPERYWIPLIGLYEGMRLGEICQLYVEDIQQVDGLWCISINGENDKRLKNLASQRIIPLHPVLLDNGFLRYVEQVKAAGNPRLWMNLAWTDVNGYSNGIGKWYQRFNREYVTDDPKKVFHSMRHTVADTLKQRGIQEAVIAEIVGHTNDSMTMGRYGKRYQPRVLLEALVLLDYGIEIPVWEQ
jgi:integrase